MAVAENTLLLAVGLAAGAICAGLAIAPAIAERGGQLPLTSSGALLLFAVVTLVHGFTIVYVCLSQVRL